MVLNCCQELSCQQNVRTFTLTLLKIFINTRRPKWKGTLGWKIFFSLFSVELIRVVRLNQNKLLWTVQNYTDLHQDHQLPQCKNFKGQLTRYLLEQYNYECQLAQEKWYIATGLFHSLQSSPIFNRTREWFCLNAGVDCYNPEQFGAGFFGRSRTTLLITNQTWIERKSKFRIKVFRYPSIIYFNISQISKNLEKSLVL